MSAPVPIYSHAGFCPVCRSATTFVAYDPWFRDALVCTACPEYSNPRDRALMLVLAWFYRDLRDLRIHESSPAPRGASRAIAAASASYVASHYFPAAERGVTVEGYRNENLEEQTFADASFDLVLSLDVMEHVNQPAAAFREIARTLVPGGRYVFTAPTDKALVQSRRQAEYRADGTVVHFAEPEYHCNPVDEKGSLVVFHYGYDLPELIAGWSGLDTAVMRFNDHHHGIIGEYTEVYVCTKPPAGRS